MATSRKYTLENPQTLQEFLEKYKDAINAKGEFIPGKANLEYDDLNAADVYKMKIGGYSLPGWTDDNGVEVGLGTHIAPQAEVNADWIEDPRSKGWIAQHPKGAAIIATIASMGAASGAGLLGAGTATTGGAAAGAGAATAGTTAASGLAGSLGMNAGYAATALNAGALNTGISLARGKNIGDSLKDGATAAVLSGVGGWAKDGISSSLVDSGLSKGVINGIATVGSKVGTGALGAAATGGDWKDGAVNGVIAAGATLVGGWAKDNTVELGKDISGAIGNTASAVTSTGLKGGNLGDAIENSLVSAASNQAGGLIKNFTGSDMMANVGSNLVSSAVKRKPITAKGIVASATRRA